MTLYGCSSDVTNWFSSYLFRRRQTVSINGTLSKFLQVDFGVPQGSILGPLLYILFTNKLQHVFHLSSARNRKLKGESTICSFADDSTLACFNTDHTSLSLQLTESYNKIRKYMEENKLKINDDKTHLVVITSSQQRAKSNSSNLVEIRAQHHIIKPKKDEKLLGCRIQDDLKWTQYLRDNEENVMKNLSQKISALQLISKLATFKTRKMLVNGVFMSRLIYMIQAWGSCLKYLCMAYR